MHVEDNNFWKLCYISFFCIIYIFVVFCRSLPIRHSLMSFCFGSEEAHRDYQKEIYADVGESTLRFPYQLSL